MKAAVLEKLNSELVIHDLVVPDLEYGQVLVKVMASGICGKQIGEIAGQYGPDLYLPHLLGHEGGGVVGAVGPGVTQVITGEHVVMHWRKGAGIDASPPKYLDENGQVIGGGPVTTFNEYAVVSENRLTVIPKDVPLEVAALMGCAITTGFGVVFNEINLKPYHTIAVIGCGGIGLSIIQAAKLIGAWRIYGVDKTRYKMDMAERFGVTHPSLAKSNFNQIDYVVNCHNGVFIQDNIKGVTYESLGGATDPNRDIPIYLEKLWRHNRIKLESLITDCFCLDEINAALDVVRSGKIGRCIIEMEQK
jgi:Zn-dependent alcohol dehydrogenase